MALNENRLDVAERLLKPHLKEDPFDVAAIRMLAELAGRIGRWKDAENLLRRAVELAPGWTAARANLALVLGRMERPSEALELLDQILAEEPDSIGNWNLKAATLGRLGEFEQAIPIYEKALERAPRQPKVWLSYGHMLKTLGRLEEGIAAYRQAISLRPELGEAWWSLANLKTIRFDDQDINEMTGALEMPGLPDEDHYHLDFALGKAMHDAGRYDDAFEHYARGNALRLKQAPYDPGDVTAKVDRSIAAFSAEAFAQRPGGCEAPDPIFVIGMPRSGSTLIEQILSSHSLVEGTSELHDIAALARQGGGYPEKVLELDPEQRRALREDLGA